MFKNPLSIQNTKFGCIQEQTSLVFNIKRSFDNSANNKTRNVKDSDKFKCTRPCKFKCLFN